MQETKRPTLKVENLSEKAYFEGIARLPIQPDGISFQFKFGTFEDNRKISYEKTHEALQPFLDANVIPMSTTIITYCHESDSYVPSGIKLNIAGEQSYKLKHAFDKKTAEFLLNNIRRMIVNGAIPNEIFFGSDFMTSKGHTQFLEAVSEVADNDTHKLIYSTASFQNRTYPIAEDGHIDPLPKTAKGTMGTTVILSPDMFMAVTSYSPQLIFTNPHSSRESCLELKLNKDNHWKEKECLFLSTQNYDSYGEKLSEWFHTLSP